MRMKLEKLRLSVDNCGITAVLNTFPYLFWRQIKERFTTYDFNALKLIFSFINENNKSQLLVHRGKSENLAIDFEYQLPFIIARVKKK